MHRTISSKMFVITIFPNIPSENGGIPTKTRFLRLAIQKIHCYNIPINNRNLARKRFPKKLSGGI
ncbi:hypothetical protein EAI89_08910 [Eubacterium sp. am_0171]|nr:hypothetical protein EAI89_08910 [Eubacterium sp. am_0171]